MLNPFLSNESIKTEISSTLVNYHNENNQVNHASSALLINHHNQQPYQSIRQNNQFVLCSSLPNCYATNSSILRSHNDVNGQILLNNNTESNFYSSSNHNDYKFNTNVLSQPNHHQLTHHGLIQGFHDSRYNYSSSYGSHSGDSSIEKSVNSPTSAGDFYRNIDSATAAAVAIAAVSNQNQISYNAGAFLRYMKPTVKHDLICKWIDQDTSKICNKVFNKMEDIGRDTRSFNLFLKNLFYLF